MSGDLKIGDVCVIQFPPGSCEACQRRNGSECTIVSGEFTGIRIGCSGGPQLGNFYLVEHPSAKLPMALHRTELRKKDPPKDDSAPRSDFTPADGDFVQDPAAPAAEGARVNHQHPEAAEYAAAAPKLERAASAISFTKDDLVMLATSGPTVGVRRAAADALYSLGQRDGAIEISTARNGAVSS